ncbi:hypothetical protein FB388_2251 [Pseudonocardia cypriaca]|uniref:DUF7144 domain-containing protein n=2 Tax=Pseudonocardia cypriaca TaxID=882449 RepID=A0A543GFM5_9PSEU|nr:hypothetical protein FB388_2251 [Pseudonocardia cypriaca]
MSTPAASRPAVPGGSPTTFATGFAMFAGVLMIIAGIWSVLAGFAAILNDEVYVTTPQYVYSFDITGWGWIHLILGVLVAVAGVGVIQGATWGVVFGIALASLSALVNFAFIPHYPVWSILIIALDVAIIWGLATYRREA